ncbi:MAG: hypothetical protein ABL891_00730 [Burkholderiales bacterium]
MDRGIWITWYDLPDITDANRNDFLAWLHGDYIPRVLARPGVLWAAHYAAEPQPLYSGKQGRLTRTDDPAVPQGTQFMLLFGGDEPHAFVNPAPAQFHDGLPAECKRLLGLRRGVRTNLMVEQARVIGPEAPRFPALSPCIQLGSFNSASIHDEDELADWYAQWYLASCAHVPGCVRARKLVSVSGWAKHAVLFEFESLEARNRNFVNHEAGHPDRAAWTDKVVRRLIHAPGSPSVARRIWPVVG